MVKESARQLLPSGPHATEVTFHARVAEGKILYLVLEGRLDSTTTGRLWQKAINTVERHAPPRLVVDASQVQYCDGSGIGLLTKLRLLQLHREAEFDIEGLEPEFQRLMDLFDPADFQLTEKSGLRAPNISEEIGRFVYVFFQEIQSLIAFIGEIGIALWRAMSHPRTIRWKDVFQVAEASGTNALPIVVLVSFLMGLILAFQSAIPMRQFGADIFVANLIALSMLRELGPLMTAIVLAGRSGSAFAAELGTMKINEEIDAMTTMGLDPLQFLVVPKIIAVSVMAPLLAAFADLVGVIGGSIVMKSLGYPLVTYFQQVLSAVTYIDLLGGLAKAYVFGILVAGIGCFRGLQTQTGATAVGDATTRSVVSGIILIVCTDGLFSIIFYYLGL